MSLNFISGKQETKSQIADYNNRMGDPALDLSMIDADGFQRTLSIQIVPDKVSNRISFLKTLGHETKGYKLSKDRYNQSILTLVIPTCSNEQTFTGNFAVSGYVETLKSLNILEVS